MDLQTCTARLAPRPGIYSEFVKFAREVVKSTRYGILKRSDSHFEL